MKEKRGLLDQASASLSKALRDALGDAVLEFGHDFKEEYAADRSLSIRKDKEDLSSPLVIIGAVIAAIEDIDSAFKSRTEKYLSEENTEDIVFRNSALLGRLIHLRTPNEKANKRSLPWDGKEATRRLEYIHKRFQAVLQLGMFDQDNARSLLNEIREVDAELRNTKARLEIDLPRLARLHISTIGSSHKLPGDRNNDDFNLTDGFGRLSVEDTDNGADPSKKTVVVFDESGCIPAYELLGLSRLGRDIHSLVLVGDKHQLPPYDPASTGGRRNARRPIRNVPQMRSLLDASTLTADTGKILLSTQYRVPKDIADMLNQRVYRGQYNTCPRANVPLSGLRMVNVPFAEDRRRKYVNPNEIQEGLVLLQKLRLDYDISNTLIITPVRIHLYAASVAIVFSACALEPLMNHRAKQLTFSYSPIVFGFRKLLSTRTSKGNSSSKSKGLMTGEGSNSRPMSFPLTNAKVRKRMQLF